MTATCRVTPAALAIAVAFGWALPAQAQESGEAAALRAEMERMRAQMEAMASRIDTLESELAQADAAGESGATEATSTAAAPASSPVDELEAEDGWTFEPSGRLQVDAGVVDAPDGISDPGLGFANEIRRARIGVGGELPGNFTYEIEVDFADGDIQLMDAALAYEAGGTTITVGHHNTFQSLEELTSSLFISFMERSAFTDAFGFERRIGLSGQYEAGDVLFQAGLFTDNVEDLTSDENNSWGLDGRVVYAPKLGLTQLHFGGSAHYRELNDAAASVRYRQRPHLHVTDTRFIDTGAIAAEAETGYGLEAAAISGRFHFAGEAFWQHVKRPGALADPTFFGGYVEAGVFLTPDDRRGYKGFKFDRVRPANPLGEGGIGALQFNVRYDYLDLIDAGVFGGTQNAYSGSLIWTPAAYTRFMIDYTHLEYDMAAIAAGTDRNYSVDVVGVRAQVDF